MLAHLFWKDKQIHGMSSGCRDFPKFEDPFSSVTQFQRRSSVHIVVLPEDLKEPKGRSCLIIYARLSWN